MGQGGGGRQRPQDRQLFTFFLKGFYYVFRLPKKLQLKVQKNDIILLKNSLTILYLIVLNNVVFSKVVQNLLNSFNDLFNCRQDKGIVNINMVSRPRIQG
eukprot:TRINITY_DN3249_c0_g2_i1.p2 TRINITY_DN3249_c0_g2~~TRINITY_DN3249_c0_g2_i1.p2  ORF type:complete len:100 (-),score=5.47 TRINITY_DN3249_c0_g2_i1:185-484(-)